MAKLQATVRDAATKPKQLRREGIIPGVLYGKHLDKSISLQVNESDVNKFLKAHSVGTQTDLVIDGKENSAMIKEVSRDPVGHKLVHIDFQALTAGEVVKVTAHLTFVNSDQIEADGVLTEAMHEIDIECLPKDIPEHINVDLADMKIGDILTVNSLSIINDDRYKILTAGDQIIAQVSAPSKAEEEPVEEGAEETAEVPVIGEEETEA